MGSFDNFLFIFLYILDKLASTDGHNCFHRLPKPHEVLHNVHIEPSHILRKRSISQNLRIHLVYDKSLQDLSKEKFKFIKEEIMPEAVLFWEKTLQVRQTVQPLKLVRQCETSYIRYKNDDPYHYCSDGCSPMTMCGEIRVPEDHLDVCRMCSPPPSGSCYTNGTSGPGVRNADFILYVSTKTTKRCGYGTTVAYAAYCQLEGALDRPVAGYVNICPNSISTKFHDLTQIAATIKHEILHALGFSAGLYAFFRDKDGKPLTPRLGSSGKPLYNKTLSLYQWGENIIKLVRRKDWLVRGGTVDKYVHMVVTPKVVEEVRNHFNCSTLEGAELEDQGIVGTALTHWEKRVFENEAMTGTYTQNPSISRITLALMEDSGWYKPNYDSAEPLSWGRNLGCGFVNNSCLYWMEKHKHTERSIHPYCQQIKYNDGLKTECTDTREAVALCNLIEFDKDLEPQYQYFSSLPDVSDVLAGRYGGSVELADYCPYIQEFSWKRGDVVIRASKCMENENSPDKYSNYALESYGNNSVCIQQSAPWVLMKCDRTHKVQHWGSGCYMHSCSDKGLSLIVEGREYPCYKEGQVLQIKAISMGYLHSGEIICPSCQEICKGDGMECPKEQDPPLTRTDIVEPAIPCASTQSHLVASLLVIMLIAAVALS
ncbi:leishmanolysin-like peptidase [Lineus longissimus]|uniref:leishmanolysin-like peptidase n=1 Tax=Lineus longissimus TaxID=88925 RepID=UPI002B4C733F